MGQISATKCKSGSSYSISTGNEGVILALQEANELTLTWPSGTAPSIWQALIDIFQPDDGLSEMQMEKELHPLKFTKKEEPQKLALKIRKVSLKYKTRLTDTKKAAHIMRLGNVHYAGVLYVGERACR